MTDNLAVELIMLLLGWWSICYEINWSMALKSPSKFVTSEALTYHLGFLNDQLSERLTHFVRS